MVRLYRKKVNDMKKGANIIVRVDSQLKQQAEILFQEMGMNMSMAINIFLKQAVKDQGIPFTITNKPNRQTQKAIKSSQNKKKLSKNFENVEDLFEDLDH